MESGRLPPGHGHTRPRPYRDAAERCGERTGGSDGRRRGHRRGRWHGRWRGRRRECRRGRWRERWRGRGRWRAGSKRGRTRGQRATTTATTTMTATSGEIKATIALRYGRRVRRAGKPLGDSATDQTTSSHRGAALPARKNPGAAHDGRAQAIVAAQRERGSGRLVASVSRGRWLQHGASWSATKHHRGQPRPGRPGVPAQARADPRQGPTAGHQLWFCMAPPWRVGEAIRQHKAREGLQATGRRCTAQGRTAVTRW